MRSITKKASSILLAGAMAASLTIGMAGTAFADETDGTTQEFSISVNGEKVAQVTKDDLSLRTASQGYLFLSGKTGQQGTWNVVCARDYITLDDLFEAAEVDQYWKPGSSLEFRAFSKNDDGVYEDLPYDKWTHFTYNDIYGTNDGNIQNRFYTDAGPKQDKNLTQSIIQASPIIAFSYKSDTIREGESSLDTLSRLATSSLEPNTRFLMGLNSNTVNAAPGEGWNMGKRLPSSLTDINIVTQ